ncbi:MAG: YitT family protein [Candidatus Symbiothrix sp.]|jgi:uncharacterized membrane-anchored protein YitT (DUF2179 family)|nr:YitT family protein [Candidatus Symbiothrix sp.]
MKISTEKHFKVYKQTILQEVQDFFFILIGLCLYALGWTGFLLPSKIISGGVTGVAALVYFATDLPVAVTYFSINAVLLVISIKIFGFKFSMRTIFGVFVLTFLLSALQSVIKEPLVHGEPFMNAIIGGMLCGSGIGLVFNFKGSTGGTDILALIINKYRRISIGKGLLICDVFVISSSYLLPPHSVENIVYGLVVLGVSSYTVDLVLNGARQSVQFFIFSHKYEEIATAINQLGRGCTLLDGTGWFSKQPVKVVVVMTKKNESLTVFRIVNSIDPQAFISQSQVIGVYGKGFEPIKS